MVQIVWFAEQHYSCQRRQTTKVQKPSNFTFCNSLQTEIIRQVEFNTIAWSFIVSKKESESEMFSEIQPNCGS